MVLPRHLSVFGRRARVLCALAALLAALTPTVFAGAVTAGAVDPEPPSRLPIDRGPAAAPPRATSSSPAAVKSRAAQPRRCGEAHASTPRS